MMTLKVKTTRISNFETNDSLQRNVSHSPRTILRKISVDSSNLIVHKSRFYFCFHIFDEKYRGIVGMDLICGYSEESSSEDEAPEEVEEEKPKKPKVWLPPPDLTTASMKERFR